MYRKIPSNKEKENYNTEERRGELYQRCMEKGTTRNFDKTYAEIGEEYDVSGAQISKDLDKIREHVRENEFDKTKIDARIVTTFNWALSKAIEENDYRAIPKIVGTYWEWFKEKR